MIVKLLTEHHYEFLSLKGGSKGSSESTLVKMPNCWKSDQSLDLPWHFVVFHGFVKFSTDSTENHQICRGFHRKLP